MYKSHFEKWGLHKNLKSPAAEELLRQKKERDDAGKTTRMFFVDSEVTNQKLQTYLKRLPEQKKKPDPDSSRWWPSLTRWLQISGSKSSLSDSIASAVHNAAQAGNCLCYNVRW